MILLLQDCGSLVIRTLGGGRSDSSSSPSPVLSLSHTHVLWMQTVSYPITPDFSMLLAKDQESLLAANSSVKMIVLAPCLCSSGSPVCLRMTILFPLPQTPPSKTLACPKVTSFSVFSNPWGKITNTLSRDPLCLPLQSLSQRERDWLVVDLLLSISKKTCREFCLLAQEWGGWEKETVSVSQRLLAKENEDWID